jgi:sulfotransferase family protein
MSTRLVMIIGFQRSGTNALFDSLAADRRIIAVNEHAENEMYQNFYLRPEPEIRNRLRENEIVLLKPISETKKRSVSDLLLEYADYDVKMIHIHRDPVNTYYSTSILWPTTPEEFIESWNVRNSSIFDIPEERKKDLVFVKYEDMILDPDVFYAAANFVNIRGRYRFHPDSHGGKKNVSRDIADRIEQGTRLVWLRLEEARTFLPRENPFSVAKLLQNAKYNLKRYL